MSTWHRIQAASDRIGALLAARATAGTCGTLRARGDATDGGDDGSDEGDGEGQVEDLMAASRECRSCFREGVQVRTFLVYGSRGTCIAKQLCRGCWDAIDDVAVAAHRPSPIERIDSVGRGL